MTMKMTAEMGKMHEMLAVSLAIYCIYIHVNVYVIVYINM